MVVVVVVDIKEQSDFLDQALLISLQKQNKIPSTKLRITLFKNGYSHRDKSFSVEDVLLV